MKAVSIIQQRRSKKSVFDGQFLVDSARACSLINLNDFFGKFSCGRGTYRFFHKSFDRSLDICLKPDNIGWTIRSFENAAFS